MKKILLSVFLLSVSHFAFAQRPEKGDKSFTFGVSGLQLIGFNTAASQTGTLLFRYYLNNGLAIRGAGTAIIQNQKGENTDGSGGRKFTNTFVNNGFQLAPGIQKSFGSHEKIEPYFGVDVVGGFSTRTQSNRTEIIDETKTFGGKNGDYTEFEQKMSGILNVGVVPMAGVNFHLMKGLSIGAEFGYGLNYNTFGKVQNTNRSRTNGIDQAEVKTTSESHSFNLQNLGNSQVNLSIYF